MEMSQDLLRAPEVSVFDFKWNVVLYKYAFHAVCEANYAPQLQDVLLCMCMW
jgi:hypothetical protein